MKNKNIRVLWLTLMLVVFIIPHISNVLHFVVVEHEFGKRSSDLEYVNSNTIHFCEQHIFKLSPLTAIDLFRWNVWTPQVYSYVMDLYKINSFDTFYNFIYLRGPPIVKVR